MANPPAGTPTKKDLVKINDYLWEIPKTFRPDMRVPARIYASERMLDELFKDRSLWQAVNLTTLPGIYKYALIMPDVHEGYGSPVGGVVAIKEKEGGIVSPGMTGYDINCGVRLLRTGVKYSEVKEKIPDLATEIYNEVPSGVGRGGSLKLSQEELDEVLRKGVGWMVEKGFGNEKDLMYCESNGVLPGADPAMVSSHAKNRARDQLGTMGAGNHFVEVERVSEIFDEDAAKVLGLFPDEVTILIHCGSRGLGHQVATAPFDSPEGQKYLAAMASSANFAWANRQLITYEVRKAWKKVFGENYELELIYDVAHTIVKREEYDNVKVLVHRKGATRAFPRGNPEIPEDYAKTCGQPVFIPGSMATSSFVLVGREGAMQESFGSSAHGAGRMMSRTKARTMVNGKTLKDELENQGIAVRAGSFAGLAEEAPVAYKAVEEVIDVIHNAGISRKVTQLKPVAVIKG
ncbi:MAG: RtcB family protein [Parcubacteria group bacterium]|nr:RtcB family protein [Parcubacteria group bacterium]